MREFLVLFVHLVVTTVRLVRPGGARAIVAESLLLKQQLLIVTRSRRRAPDLRPLDRIVAGLCAGLLHKARIQRCAIVLKPATILSFQRLLVKRKYRELFSPKRRGRPGPKDPSAELIAAIVEMKRRNPRFAYQGGGPGHSPAKTAMAQLRYSPNVRSTIGTRSRGRFGDTSRNNASRSTRS